MGPDPLHPPPPLDPHIPVHLIKFRSFSDGALDTRQQQLKRLQHLHRVCTDKDVFKDVMYTRRTPIVYYYSSKYNFSYCKVPKVGCSFWTQAFTILQNNFSAAGNVFNMNRRTMHDNLGPAFTVHFKSKARRKSRTVLISRDPYSKLFSAFIDKMVLPGYHSTAVGIVRRQRQTKSSCANDVTFEEFLKFIIESVRIRKKLDRHWAPIDNICHPCKVNPFALVKMETFTADVEYILKEVGISDNEFETIHDALHDHRLEATITGLVKEKSVDNLDWCMDRIELARRFWKAFKVQGYIKDDIPFPTKTIDTNEKAKNPDFILQVILETIRKHPISPNEAKLQRRRALVEAFDGVSKDVLDYVKALYKQDFLLFDYSTEPPTMGY